MYPETAEKAPPETPKEWNEAEQRAARDAVLAIPIFPALEKELIGVFGFSPAVVFVHQLCYWFGKPKMEHRWSLYVTAEGWHEQRGINRKALAKARQRAINAGVVSEKTGLYKRLQYRIDWVRLAELLGLSLPLRGRSDEEDQAAMIDTFKGTDMIDTPEGAQEHPDKPDKQHTYKENGPQETHNKGVQTNAGDYAEDHKHKTPFARGADASSSRTAPQRKGEGENPETPTDGPTPIGDKRNAPASRGSEAKAAARGRETQPPSDHATEERARGALLIVRERMPSPFGGMVAEGDWSGLNKTMKVLGITDEKFSESVVAFAAKTLDGVALEAAG